MELRHRHRGKTGWRSPKNSGRGAPSSVSTRASRHIEITQMPSLLGASRQFVVRWIVNLDEGEAVGRCHHAAPLSALQQFRGPTRRSPPVTDPQEGSDQTSDHGMAESVCRHREMQLVLVHPLPTQFEELPDGGGAFPLLAESCEVVETQQRRRGFVHCVHGQGPRPRQRIASL